MWKLASDRPIYLQLMEKIEVRIVSGRYHPGDKLPSVRELAEEASVNPNTMQKALSELERSGLVYAQRTNGRFITEDTTMIEDIRKQLVKEQLQEFLDKMKKYGYSPQDIISLIEVTAKAV